MKDTAGAGAARGETGGTEEDEEGGIAARAAVIEREEEDDDTDEAKIPIGGAEGGEEGWGICGVIKVKVGFEDASCRVCVCEGGCEAAWDGCCRTRGGDSEGCGGEGAGGGTG